MKSYILIISLCIIASFKLANADVYIDDPGNTVIQSSPITIAEPVNVDYYTPTPPGTHLKLISGGSTVTDLRVYNYGQLTLSGGSVGGSLWFRNNSSGDIISGNVGGYLRVMGSSQLTMSGGNILSDWMGVFDNGQAEIFGGNFGDLSLSAYALVAL